MVRKSIRMRRSRRASRRARSRRSRYGGQQIGDKGYLYNYSGDKSQLYGSTKSDQYTITGVEGNKFLLQSPGAPGSGQIFANKNDFTTDYNSIKPPGQVFITPPPTEPGMPQ